jgi:hypothetical protein
MGIASFLDRDHSVAKPGYSRWLVPPAALAIHLSTGQVYAFSVFVNPILAYNAADGCAWSHKEVGYIFSRAIAMLVLSAALFGNRLVAGAFGPLIVNVLLDHSKAAHQPLANAYPLILHIMACLLLLGFLANLFVRPVAARFRMAERNTAPLDYIQHY